MIHNLLFTNPIIVFFKRHLTRDSIRTSARYRTLFAGYQSFVSIYYYVHISRELPNLDVHVRSERVNAVRSTTRYEVVSVRESNSSRTVRTMLVCHQRFPRSNSTRASFKCYHDSPHFREPTRETYAKTRTLEPTRADDESPFSF